MRHRTHAVKVEHYFVTRRLHVFIAQSSQNQFFLSTSLTPLYPDILYPLNKPFPSPQSCTVIFLFSRSKVSLPLPFHQQRFDFVMIGSNGSPENDRIYLKYCQKLFPDIPLLQYKNIFGESYTAPAFAVYAAALCLKNRHIPKFLSVLGTQYAVPNKILIYNHFKNKNHSFIILSRQP